MSDSTLIIFAILIAFGLIILLRGSKASQQQRAVKSAGFTARPMMNKSEMQLFQIVNNWLRKNALNHYISPQATYGSFLGCRDYKKWRLMSAKRADLVIFDKHGNVRLIIEFDGAGHYGKSRKDAYGTRNRDEQKNLAAAAAGLPLIRITSLKDRDAIIAALSEILIPTNSSHHPHNEHHTEAQAQ